MSEIPIASTVSSPTPLLRAMAMMVGSTLCFVGMHALVTKVSQDLHPIEVAFFRNLFGFVVLMPALIRSRFTAFRTTKLHLHALRGGVNSVSMMMFFSALAITPLAQATALSYTAPLFMTIGAVFFLGETLRARRIVALVVGFVGALIVLRPGLVPLDLGPILVVSSAVLWAISMIDIKILSRTDSSLTIATYMLVFVTPITFIAALFVWETPSWESLGWLFLLGGLGSLGHILFAESFKQADTTVLMPLDFTKMIWAAILGFLFFGQVPDLWTWVGGTVIFASATYISYREHQLARRAAAPTHAGNAGKLD
ncbi:MAG TPA: DMT family transporter [Ferrovibrio sp.]|jgi:drug/metabolite transporter (DMT)-like permease|uniref:DMT family transporter n=1 Tax=Ferrovibrio sp. TaxID=1917215 RepID=UPI002B4B4F02|nr:DMT family transporter [Ferrovibrio sp.]HLT76026.1 DMT family transporter [Ferrovibrio sp.]